MEVHSEEGEVVSLKFINNVFNLVILACIVLSVLGFVFTEQIVKMFAVGYEGEALTVAINFTRITILGIVFTGLSYVMTSYLQIKNDFVMPGLSSVSKNIIIIVATILSMKYGPYLMIWGTLVGMASEFLFQLHFAIKRGYKYLPIIDVKDEYIKKMAWLTGPVLIGVAINQVNTLVDRTLASTLPVGTIVLSKPIVRVLFERGAFDERGTYLTALALAMYSIGMVASVVMGAVAYYSYYYMMGFTHTGGESEFVVLMVAVTLAAAVYGGLVMLFKVDEIRIVTDVVKRRLKK